MENQIAESTEAQVRNSKSEKPKAKVTTETIRIKKETKKTVLGHVAALNKKDFGRTLTTDDVVAKAVALLRPEHLAELQESSLTSKDHFGRKYREYCAEHGKLSEDEFLIVLLGAQSK